MFVNREVMFFLGLIVMFNGFIKRGFYLEVFIVVCDEFEIMKFIEVDFFYFKNGCEFLKLLVGI